MADRCFEGGFGSQSLEKRDGRAKSDEATNFDDFLLRLLSTMERLYLKMEA